MSQSLYLRLATVLVRLDLHREQVAWQKQHRRIRYQGPHLSDYVLRDIGFEKDGYSVGHSAAPEFVAKREVARIRRRLRLNAVT